LNVDLRIRNFVVSHKVVIKFQQLAYAYQAWKMQNAAYGFILSLPIVHYFQIERITANCDGNVYWTKWRNSWRRSLSPPFV